MAERSEDGSWEVFSAQFGDYLLDNAWVRQVWDEATPLAAPRVSQRAKARWLTTNRAGRAVPA